MDTRPKSNTILVNGGVHTGANNLRIAMEILVCLMIIFFVDISTPLGLSAWILYFIPLFLALYLEVRHGPFYVTVIIIILISASFFLSPQDMSPLYAFLNRVFFSCMLIASAFLIWHHQESGEALKRNERNYRILTEWSPDAVFVYRDGSIRYASRASLRLFGPDPAATPIGKDILDLVQSEHRDLVREQIRQASLGAQGEVSGVSLVPPVKSDVRLDMVFREVCWDGSLGVLILARINSSS